MFASKSPPQEFVNSWGDYDNLIRFLPQLQRTSPPTQLEFAASAHTEFVICDCPIEPTFRDWKSAGFDLEQTQIDDAHRLQILVLGLAVTTLWMIHIGDWQIRQGHRRQLDRIRHPDYSLFRLGRDFVRRAQTLNWSIPVGFSVMHP